MQREPRKYLWDARKAAGAIANFTRGKSFDDFRQDILLHILIHGYAAIDQETVWRVVQENLPALDASLAALLEAGNEPKK